MKKICVVVASRANYGRVKSCLSEISKHENLQLQLIVSASALLDKFGSAYNIIETDGFKIDRKLQYLIEGENLITQAKSTGLGVIELSSAFEDLKPDAVITVADRFETMSTAIAASYMNIPLIHIQGGEVSGNIDDKVRHSISKLSDYHFCCTELSKTRLLRMAEPESRVFNVGCPAMDIIDKTIRNIDIGSLNKYSGVGDKIDWSKPYFLIMYHPVTTSYGQGGNQMMKILNAVKDFPQYQKIVLWPNVDAGSDDVSKAMRVFRESVDFSGFHYFKNFSPEDFIKVLSSCSLAIGNSSSFVREGEFMSIPAIMTGDRQSGRELGDNVLVSEIDIKVLKENIRKMLNWDVTRTKPSIYGDGSAGFRIACLLSEIDFTLKRGLSL